MPTGKPLYTLPFTNKMTHKLNKTSPSFSLCSIAMLLCMLMAQPSAEGAIVNGGFEDTLDTSEAVMKSSLDNWTISQTDINKVIGRDTTVLYALAPHGGFIDAAFNSDPTAEGSGASLTQALTTDTTKTYNVSLWVANPIQEAGNINNVFSVTWDGALISLSGANITETALNSKTYIVTAESGWNQITATNLPVTTTSTNLVISARNNQWATLVDDVTVEETPEPSTVVMLGIGAALMGLRRRRQQRAA
jgi:hypothetical protein